jgi:hypothetical protein
VIARGISLLLAATLAQAAPQPAETPAPQRLLGMIRAQFRSHRPPPPYVSYTFVRTQKTDLGYPDVVNSYTYHVWCRTTDRAAMGRKVFREGYEYPPEFLRPAFNEDRDPGPPTADVFEPAPVRPRPISEVPTPEPTRNPAEVIGRIEVFVESDYRVLSVETTGGVSKLTVEPIRDKERNRLREIDVDAKTLELQRLVATDKLFITGGRQVFGVTFTITMGNVAGHLVVTEIHGHVNDGYVGDGVDVDMVFRDITFPETLPDWYFNPRQYGMHQTDAPK